MQSNLNTTENIDPFTADAADGEAIAAEVAKRIAARSFVSSPFGISERCLSPGQIVEITENGLTGACREHVMNCAVCLEQVSGLAQMRLKSPPDFIANALKEGGRWTPEEVRQLNTDESLLAAFSVGNDEAFEELARRYMPILRRRCREYLRHPAHVEDVVQRALLKTYQCGKSLKFEGVTGFDAWIGTMAADMARHAAQTHVANDKSPLLALVALHDAVLTVRDAGKPVSFACDIIPAFEIASPALPIRDLALSGALNGKDAEVAVRDFTHDGHPDAIAIRFPSAKLSARVRSGLENQQVVVDTVVLRGFMAGERKRPFAGQARLTFRPSTAP